jgi:hydroxymethylpyrimidine pyrophosphatase-like HAD family hydrolase
LRLRAQTVGAIETVDDLLANLPPRALEVGTIDRRELVFELTEAIRRELDDEVQVINTRSLLGDGLYYWAEVYDRGCNKGAGVRQLATEYGLDPRRIVAIGDNYNDLDLFAVARWRIAMANGPQEVRRAADRIAPTVRESGAALLLEEIASGRYPPADEIAGANR